MSHEAYKAFDGDEDTFWQSSNIVGNHTLGYKFDVAQTIMRYAIQANVSESDFSYPTDWTFEGSNNGSDWYTLDTQSEQSFTIKQKKYYNIVIPSSFLYYRLNISNYVPLCICGSETIGYTSNQMSINGQQTLTVVGASEGCTYYWEITSGGGSLSSNTGTSVVYTAPSTNPNCESNPTITMSCESTLKGTLKIAVNGDLSGTYGVEECMMELSPESGGAVIYMWCRQFRCNGTFNDRSHSLICAAPSPDCEDGFANWCATLCKSSWGCYRDEPCNIPVDVRTPTQKANGCCPEQLL